MDMYYPTWQEAARSLRIIKEGISSPQAYERLHGITRRLPPDPDYYYNDFPGWVKFLGTEEIPEHLSVGRNRKKTTKRVAFYPTWQEASDAVQKIEGNKNSITYKKLYKNDQKLPSNPNSYYKDFPGWDRFFNRNCYSTWREASIAVRKIIAIVDARSYAKLCNKDIRLPIRPERFYKDFPGWEIFIYDAERNFYPSWQEASSAAMKIAGIKNAKTYKELHRSDSRLLASPEKGYKDFPGWYVFLGGK